MVMRFTTLQTFDSVTRAQGREGWNMKRAFRSKSIALTIAAVMLATLIPTAFAQEEPPGPNGPVTGNESVLFLTRGADDLFHWEGASENIRVRKNDCTAITFSGADLVTVEAIGGALGDVKDGFGVLSASEGSGEPCGRIDAPDQSVAVELSGLLSDYAMSRVDLDLELKFDATATLTFHLDGSPLTFDSVRRVDGGVAHPVDGGVVTIDPDSDSSDNGPDSKDGDNYRVYAEPLDCDVEAGLPCNPVLFDRIEISATQGSVSLEGGADLASSTLSATSIGQIYEPGVDDVDIDTKKVSSQFGIVGTYDGTLECGDTVRIGNGTSEAQGTFTRLVYGDCATKFYDLVTSADTIDFAPASGSVARYSALLTSIPYTSANPVPQKLEYDPDGDGPLVYKDMQWCLTEPADWAAVSDPPTTVLPSGETWCIIDAATVLVPGDGIDPDRIQTTWTVIGQGDPGFRFG